MSIYKKQAKKEDKHYLQQLKKIKEIVTKMGYTKISFEDTRGTNLDLHKGIDVIMYFSKDGQIYKTGISLRCRENWNGRSDFLMRYKASEYDYSETEFDKLMNGNYKAKYLFYSWHNNNNSNEFDWIFVPIAEIVKFVKTEKFINIINNKDGCSQSFVIPLNKVKVLKKHIRGW